MNNSKPIIMVKRELIKLTDNFEGLYRETFSDGCIVYTHLSYFFDVVPENLEFSIDMIS